MLFGGVSAAQDIAFFAAAGVKAPAEELIVEFERTTGLHVRRVYDTAGAAEQKFVAAGKHGVLVTTTARIRSVAASGQGTSHGVGDTLAGVAVAERMPRLPLTTADDLRAALLLAKRVAFSDPARGATVGTHFLKVLDQLHIRDEVLAKSVKARDGIETMKLVMAGEVDLGITQVSEIMQTAPHTLLGPFPVSVELATRYDLWYADDSSPAVTDLAAVFTSASGRAAMARHGLRAP
jgi:molybdate transport system substrate-binding protein